MKYKRCLLRGSAHLPMAVLLALSVMPTAHAAVGGASSASGNSASGNSGSANSGNAVPGTAASGNPVSPAGTTTSTSSGTGSNNVAAETAPFVTNTQGTAPFGTSVQLGNIGSVFSGIQNAFAPPSFASQGITITPSLGAQEQFITGTYQNGGGRNSEFVTSIRPGLLVAGERPNLTVAVNYDPQIQIYSNHNYGNTISQSLNAAVDAALIPGALNLALRGYATTQSTIGGLAPGGYTVLGNNNTTLTQSYSVEPSFQHYFSGAGTLDLAYVLGITRQSGNTAYLPNTSLPYFQNGNFTSQTEDATFTTVPIFYRFDDIPSVSMTEDTGTGVLNSAHQYFYDNMVRYALTRHALLTASGGYEDIYYSGIPPVRIQDATWSIGFQLTPAENASIIFQYQHRYGFNAPYFAAIYPITARTTLAASYTDELGTQQQQLGQGVAASSVNSFGLPVSGVSGVPVLLTNQALSVQSSLQRQSTLAFSSTTTYSRDSISFSVLRQSQKLVATAPGFAGFSQSSLSGNVDYTHQLSEVASFSTYLNYTRTNSIALGAGTTSSYAASFTYGYQFSPSLSGYAQYLLTNQDFIGYGNQYLNNGNNGTSLQNSIIVGIQKTF